MLWVYAHYKYFNSFSAWAVYIKKKGLSQAENTCLYQGMINTTEKYNSQLVWLIFTFYIYFYCNYYPFCRCVVRDLPPTPSKFHYIFNLRDLSRIYNGMCLTTPDRFDRVDQFLRVWRNECMRVIFDRLISDSDAKLVFVNIISYSYCNHSRNCKYSKNIYGRITSLTA